MLKEYSSLDKIVLVKNPYYYLANEVKLDGIQNQLDALDARIAALE